MVLLLLGLILWIASHLMIRLAPDLRQRLGGKAGTALMNLAALALMIFGYRSFEGTFYWGRDPMLTGINNLLVLIAVYFSAAHGMKTAVARHIRHPLLWGVVLWAVAHILVNGDTPSFLLFDGMLIWAFLQMAAISRAEGPWVRPAAKPAKFEIFAVLGTVIVFGGASLVHKALGYPVFG